MGTYIAHTRRKIKTSKQAEADADADAIAAREAALAALREQHRLEAERIRAEKAARAMRRAVTKRMSADTDMTGRRRTAARAAGIMLISATGGVRTQSVSLLREPGAAGADLWRADVQFDSERGGPHYINDLATPAERDALHAMRALAPRIAEHVFIAPPPDDGVDDRNMNTAFRLARSFMQKTQYTATLDEEEKHRLSLAIFEELQSVAAMRLRQMQTEYEQIVEILMQRARMSRSECNAILGSIYQGYEEFLRARDGRPPLAAISTESPAPEDRAEAMGATGTHGR